jgi:phosphoglycolate phosphatase-like HAD superfamily hydrolase
VVSSIIGNPLYDTFYALTGNSEKSEAALIKFRQVYKDEFMFDYALYPGVKRFLQKAAWNNHTLFVVTNKARLLAEMILEHAGLLHFFTGVYGPGLNKSIKKKELLKQLCTDHRHIDHNNSIFIGDTLNDQQAASALKMETMIMLHGYGNKNDFFKLPVTFFRNFAELQTRFLQKNYAAV